LHLYFTRRFSTKIHLRYLNIATENYCDIVFVQTSAYGIKKLVYEITQLKCYKDL
jgi:hypothetical protein